MISEQEIEVYADQIAEPDWRARIEALIGHLDDADCTAVLERAAQKMRQIGDAALAEAARHWKTSTASPRPRGCRRVKGRSLGSGSAA